MLHFHGNGEIVDDYELSAPFYNEIGINLFVADYRGYGFSDGRSTISNMLIDSHLTSREFNKIVEEYGSKKSILVMGRSLGSISAIAVAYHHQNAIQGLVIKNGSANNFRHLFPSSTTNHPIWKGESPFLNKMKMLSISKPTLIIYAEYDTIVPLEEGKELFRNAAANDKRLIIIPDAGHNDLMLVGKAQYVEAIDEFVKPLASLYI